MIVVLDSNVWLSELGLRSGAAAAVRFFFNQSKARVAVPEVIQLEVRHNLTNRLSTHAKEIRDNYRQLLTAFGKLRELVLQLSERTSHLSGRLPLNENYCSWPVAARRCATQDINEPRSVLIPFLGRSVAMPRRRLVMLSVRPSAGPAFPYLP